LGGGFGNNWSIESKNNLIEWKMEEKNIFNYMRLSFLIGYSF
jgi:hypothetical protein